MSGYELDSFIRVGRVRSESRGIDPSTKMELRECNNEKKNDDAAVKKNAKQERVTFLLSREEKNVRKKAALRFRLKPMSPADARDPSRL